MRQTLFYLPSELFGVPIFGAGLLFWAILLIWFLGVVRALFHKNFSDAIFYSALAAFGLFFVRAIGVRIVETNGFPIRGYGVFLMLALVFSSWLTIARGKRLWNYPTDKVLAIIFVAAFFGIIGARTFYVLQYWRDVQGANIRETLINAIDATSGGLVVYGSIIGGTLAVVVYICVKRLPLLATLDLFAPSLALGIAIGRLGCLMNGCCFGGVCDLPWAITFPNGSPAHIQQTSEGVISLYGITLRSSEPMNSSVDLFAVKSRHTDLSSNVSAPAIVESVDVGSAAEEVGLCSGARICELGLVPKGLFDSGAISNESVKSQEIRLFNVKNNAQVFYFFLNMWDNSKDYDVLLVYQTPPQKPSDSEFHNVVFHPTPTPAKPVHPTQIYSSLTALCICVVLLLLSRFVKKDGIIAACLLILYPSARFCLELIRTDEGSFCGTGLTVSQCVSIVVATIGIGLMIFAMTRPPKRALLGYFDSPENENKSKKDEKANVENVKK